MMLAEAIDGSQGPVTVSPALDMWALGCITYRIFKGKTSAILSLWHVDLMLHDIDLENAQAFLSAWQRA